MVVEFVCDSFSNITHSLTRATCVDATRALGGTPRAPLLLGSLVPSVGGTLS